jgi:isoleucyl-tRNA synthetase
MSGTSRFEVSDKINFSQQEEKTGSYWSEIDAFQTSLKLSEGRPEYTFYDGPPFATGLPHYGHLLASTIKDIVTRYAHQTGHYVSRRAGWDCHGLPVEYEIDKKLGIKDREQVLEMGIKAYNNECRSIVQRYTKEWRTTVTRLGRWIDFDNDYKTMDPNFMESIWWVFSQLYEKGLVYRGYKVMPFSTACGTPVSNFEAGMNYKDVNDPACVVHFPLVDDPECSLVAWTTTPWTLPSNLALCVNPAFEYVKILDKQRNKTFVLLEKRIVQLFPEVGKADCSDERKAELYEIKGRLLGSALVGKRYTPIFQYFAEGPAASTYFQVCGDSYVTEEGGTGIVHQAPAFGEDDYRVCLNHGVISKGEDIPCPVDSNGRFTEPVSPHKGEHVKAADAAICALLKASGRLILKETYAHSYPFCWRSDTPLIYKAVPSWFVKVESIRDRLLKNNAETYWVPNFVKEGRFHNWLRDAKDWAISRNRFWGTPIPLWISEDLQEVVVIDSVEKLYELSGVRVTDLHKDTVDDITIPSKQGKGVLRRVEEVFDCWFESGSMPYAQLHYPFENKERFEKGFPADFIAEGMDQTRGWFYTLMVLSTALFDRPAFKNLIVNGLVLASDGKKMSKRLLNYPDPNNVIAKYGADAVRLYLINSPVVRADTMRFQEEGVNDTVRGVFLPWYNAFRFFMQCQDMYNGQSAEINSPAFQPDSDRCKKSTNDLDQWVQAAVFGLVSFVHEEMRAYRLYTVVPRLLKFIDELTNWYVRLNRERLKGARGRDEQLTGLSVLFEVLLTMALVMSPVTPFFSEYLYQNLRCLMETKEADAVDAPGKAESVHYLMLPAEDESRMNPAIVKRFEDFQVAVGLCRLARERRKIRSNLPLKKVVVVCADESTVAGLEYLKQAIKDEINAWDVQISAEYTKMCVLQTIPDFKVLGKKVGKQMKDVQKAINSLTHDQIVAFMESNKITICGFEMTQEDIVVKRAFSGDSKVFEAAASDNGAILVAIDTTCDEEVLSELRARTLAATVQKLRKSAGLQIGDAVDVYYEEKKPVVEAALSKHSDLTIKRIKSVPQPMKNKPIDALVVGEQLIKDQDLSKEPVRLQLVLPCVQVAGLLDMAGGSPELAQTLETYLVSMDLQYLLAQASVQVINDGVTLTLEKGKHYFAFNDRK